MYGGGVRWDIWQYTCGKGSAEQGVGSVAGNRQTKQLDLSYDGYFGYNAVLMIDMGSANAGLYANLFHYKGRADF